MLSWCRLCLKRSDNFHSLLDSKILNKIESLASLKFDLNDKLPQNCCQSCVDNVITSYNFQQLILESARWLEDNLNDQNPFAFEENYDLLQEGTHADVEPKLETNENMYKTEEDLVADFIPDDVQNYIQNNETQMTFPFVQEGYVNQEVVVYDAESSPEYETFEQANSSVTSPVSFTSDTISNIPVDVEISFEQSSDNVEDKFTCEDCNLKFPTKRNLQKHKMKHNIEQCPHCEVTMRRDNLKRHIQKHSDPPIKCQICGTIAKNRESLRGHINYHHRDNPIIKCEDCPKEFKSRHHYKTHVKKVHLNIKNAQCEFCGNKFFANHDLQKHIRMKHHKERPFPCEECSKYFSSRYALKTHMRQHNGEKPYICHLCDSAFKQKVSLNSHLASRHNEEKI